MSLQLYFFLLLISTRGEKMKKERDQSETFCSPCAYLCVKCLIQSRTLFNLALSLQTNPSTHPTILTRNTDLCSDQKENQISWSRAWQAARRRRRWSDYITLLASDSSFSFGHVMLTNSFLAPFLILNVGRFPNLIWLIMADRMCTSLSYSSFN